VDRRDFPDAVQRVMVPCVQYVLLDGLKTLCGIESMHALPALLCSDDALMSLVSFKAQQVRQGVCQRGARARQGARTPGPICPDTLQTQIFPKYSEHEDSYAGQKTQKPHEPLPCFQGSGNPRRAHDGRASDCFHRYGL
jgi:hypothetical protein